MKIEIYEGENLANNLEILGVPVIYNNYIITPNHIIYNFDYKDITTTSNKLKAAVRSLGLFLREKIDIIESNCSHFALRFNRKERSFPHFSIMKHALAGKPYHFLLGKDSQNKTLTYSLDKAPHMLIAGATGSGKSVYLNNLILGFASYNEPKDLGLILIDPKQVEFAPYENLPHLMCPIINSVDIAINTLNSLCNTMEKRYSILKRKKQRDNNSNVFSKIVVIIDELADLMLTNKKAIETPLVKLAQKGRACGIHLILATQRPTVNVVTGLLKANIPTRIAFSMSSMRDSMVILDYKGAEELLGKGDCLVKLPDRLKPIRLQAPYVSNNYVLQQTRDLPKRRWKRFSIGRKKIFKNKVGFKIFTIKELNDYDTFED